MDALNETGTTATDMVAILEALREAGSLRAELIIVKVTKMDSVNHLEKFKLQIELGDNNKEIRGNTES